MKKIIIGLALVLFTAVANAGGWQVQQLMAGGVTGLYITNTMAVTNLLTSGANTTNYAGTTFTNNGTRVTVATNTSMGTWKADDLNLLADYVSIPRLADGSPFYNLATNTLNYPQSGMDVAIKLTGGSGANSAVSFVFTPLYGAGLDLEGGTANEWTVGVTATTTTAVTIITNVPLYKWPGAGGFRLRRIVNADTDASSEVILNELSVNSYRP